MPSNNISNFWTARHDRAVLPLCCGGIIILFALHHIQPEIALWVSVGLFLLGIPHGATERLDCARQPVGHSGKARRPTIAYTLIYLVFGILIFSAWLISAVPTFICFLMVSAWHFGRSEPKTLGFFWSMTIGFWVILGAFLVFPDYTLSIFSALTGTKNLTSTEFSAPAPFLSLSLQWIPRILQISAIIVALAMFVTAIRHPTALHRGVAMFALFTILPPISAVAVYFFMIHSLRETARTLDALQAAPDFEGQNLFTQWLKVYAPASLPALFGAISLVLMIAANIISIDMAAGLAVAFIIPHMFPLERLTQAAAEELHIEPV